MSSFDGADRPGAGRAADDHDPVRSSTPADPWLAEAPTSALGDAVSAPTPDPAAGQVPASAFGDAAPTTGSAAGPVPPADTARFDDAVPFGSPPSGWGDPPPPQGRRGRRATRWIVAVLAVAALFIAGVLALDQFGSGSGGDRDALGSGPSAGSSRGTATGKPTSEPAAETAGGPVAEPAGGPSSTTASAGPASAGPDSSAAGSVVIYEVTASGSKNTGSVSYTDQDGDIIRRGGIPLPWRTTFSLGDRRKPPLVLISQRKGGGDAGPVTCTITLDGKVLSSTTAEGRYASAQCSG